MIQRLQSVYMFLTTLLSLLFLKGSILNFSDKTGSVIKVTFAGILKNTGGQNFELIEKLLPLSVFIILIPALSLITIFIFKNRKIQLLLSLFVIILISGFILLSIYYSWFIISDFRVDLVPGFKMIIPVVILILAVFAFRGIRKDDRLIKSYDRLR